MHDAITKFDLAVPSSRADSVGIQWLRSQPPSVVADALDCAHAVFSTAPSYRPATGAHAETQEQLKLLGQENEALLQAKEKAVHNVKAEAQEHLKLLRQENEALLQAKETAVHNVKAEAQEHLKLLRQENEALLQAKETAVHEMKATTETRCKNKFEITLQMKEDELALIQAQLNELRKHEQDHIENVRDQEQERARVQLTETARRYTIELQHAKQAETSALQALQEQKELARATIDQVRTECLMKSNENAKLISDSIAKLTSTHGKGVVGENIALSVFSELDNYGELNDTRHDTSTGCEDYLWEQRGSDGIETLRCSVEIKNTMKIHKQHDIEKHLTRIQEAARAGKINAALFLSLRCKIPHTRAVTIRRIAGIPVLYVSGLDLTPVQVVEIGFRVMAQLWSALPSGTTSEDLPGQDTLFNSVAELIGKQLNHLTQLNGHIDEIERHANAQLKTASKLHKLRQEFLSEITNIQSTHDIWPVSSQRTSDPIDYQALESAVVQYHEKNARYPKNEAQLGCKLPDGITIDAINQRVKASKKESNKRPRLTQSTIAPLTGPPLWGQAGSASEMR